MELTTKAILGSQLAWSVGQAGKDVVAAKLATKTTPLSIEHTTPHAKPAASAGGTPTRFERETADGGHGSALAYVMDFIHAPKVSSKQVADMSADVIAAW